MSTKSMAAQIAAKVEASGQRGVTVSELYKKLPTLPERRIQASLWAIKKTGRVYESGDSRPSLINGKPSTVYMYNPEGKPVTKKRVARAGLKSSLSKRAAADITDAVNVLRKYGIEI